MRLFKIKKRPPQHLYYIMVLDEKGEWNKSHWGSKQSCIMRMNYARTAIDYPLRHDGSRRIEDQVLRLSCAETGDIEWEGAISSIER